MKKKLRKEPLWLSIVLMAVLIILALVMLFPIGLVVNVSLKSIDEFRNNPTGIFEIKSFSELVANYIDAFKVLDIFKRLLYTLFITISSAVISCIVVVLVSYPLARNHFKGTGKVLTFIIISMFFPGSLVANIFLVQKVGLYNNPLVLLIFWGFGGLTVYIFMAIGFIKTIPVELDEAAFIDGCGYYRYIFSIVIHMLKPILTTIFILKLVGAWNDFLTPYVYLVEDRYMTISTGLYAFKGQFSSNWPGLAAATFTVSTPVIILYIFMQRYIIDGMTDGALKG